MKNNKTKPGSSGRKHMEKEKIKHKEEDNNVMVEAPPTCNQANARKVGPWLKGLQRV